MSYVAGRELPRPATFLLLLLGIFLCGCGCLGSLLFLFLVSAEEV